jgi:small nuclear ribonucleoprotein E
VALARDRQRMNRVQNLIFRFLQNKSRIQIMLYEHNDMRIEGRIIVRASTLPSALRGEPIGLAALSTPCQVASSLRLQGFDEYMNLVLDDAEEISMKKKTVKPLGV